MVLVGNDNDRNAGFVGGSGVEEVFRWSSDISPMKVAVTTSIGSDFTVVTKDSRLLKIFGFRDSKECLGFYFKVLS